MFRQTHVLAIFSVLLWSTAFAGVKIGLQYAQPFFFAGARFMLAGILIIPFTGRIHGYASFFRTNWRIVLLVSLYQTGIFYALYFHGIDRVPAAVGAVVMGSEPLFAAITAHIFTKDDRFNLRKIISITAAIAGVVLLSADRDFGDAAGLREFIGILMLLGACIVGSLGQMLVKKRGLNPLYLNSQQIFLGGLMLMIMSPITGESLPTEVPLSFFAALLWLSFVSAFAFSIWYSLLKRPEVKVSEVNLYKFIVPVAGAIMSWLLIPSDTPDLITILGMVLISGSIIIFYSRKPKVIAGQ